jgi:transcriptional regulator with XRE-family HTH domain
MEIHQCFSQFIKTKRKQKNLKVKELAAKAGVSKAFIYLVETEQNNPSIRTAGSILSALEESWESFIAYSKEAA